MKIHYERGSFNIIVIIGIILRTRRTRVRSFGALILSSHAVFGRANCLQRRARATLFCVPSGSLRISCSFSDKAQTGRRGADKTRAFVRVTEAPNRRRDGHAK
jgi:hypothetical protein